MSRSALYSKHVFFRRMKKKPPLQAILDNLTHYTKEQLASDSIGQPLWIRDLLVELKENNGRFRSEDAESNANTIADSMDEAARRLYNYDPHEYEKIRTREVRRWVGQNIEIGDTFVVNIVHGEIFQIFEDEESIRLGSNLIKINSQDWQTILYNSELVGDMTRGEFYDAVQVQLNKRHGIVVDPRAPEGTDQSPPPGKLTGINPNQIERLGMRRF